MNIFFINGCFVYYVKLSLFYKKYLQNLNNTKNIFLFFNIIFV